MKTLLHRLEELVEAEPEAPVFTFLDGQGRESDCLTRHQLRRKARALAGGLEGLEGRPVMLMLGSGLDFITSFVGCQYAGCLPVPVMPPRPGRPCEHVRAILEDCQPELVIAAQDPQLGCPHQTPEGLQRDACSTKLPAGGDLALLQYTSGSTANPRGVKVSHANLVHNTGMIREAFGQPQGCTLVGWLPLSHDMGLIGIVLQTLQVGGHGVLMAPETFLLDPFRWLEAVSRYRAHTSGGPNFGYELCLRRIAPEQRAQLDLSAWKVAFNGAEPVRERTVRAFGEAFNLAPGTVYPCYGLAEATLFVTGAGQGAVPRVLELDPAALEHGEAREQAGGRSVVCCGRSWGSQRLTIVDHQTGEHCPPGRVGEVCVEGPSVSQGYWGRPPWEGPLQTGDLGFLIEGGLYLVGRCKDLIVIRGRNLHPQDIEATLEQAHPAVRPGCCAAFSVEVEEEEHLAVAAEVRGERSEEIRQSLSQAVLRGHDVAPHQVILLEPGSIPKTTSGKVRRNACRGLLPTDTPDLRSFLIAQVARALAVEPEAVDPSRCFDSLGLDSVARFGLTGELARWSGRSLPGDVTWVHDSIDKLVAHLEGVEERRELLRLREGPGTPLLVVHGLRSDVEWCADLVKHLPDTLPVLGLTLAEDPASFPSLEAVARRHIETIKRHQSEGPYRLIGYSYSGKLAFEIGRQLSEQGDQVSFLGVLDGYPRTKNYLPWRERLPRQIAKLPRRIARKGLLDLATRLISPVSPVKEPRIGAGMQPFRAYIELAFRYEPRPFPGRVTLLRCKHEGSSHALSARSGGWDEYARGGVDVIDLDGDHHSILREPHACAVAQHLAARLV